MTNRVNVRLLNRAGTTSDYSDVETITLPSTDGVNVEAFTAGVPLDNSHVTLDFTGGVSQQYVEPPSGYVYRGAIIDKPSTLVPENIVNGVDIAGVLGSFEAITFSDILYRTLSGSYEDSAITSIPDYTFCGFSLLTSLAFPNCSRFGSGAFSGCTSLSSVAFDDMSYVAAGAYTFARTVISEFMPTYGLRGPAASGMFLNCRNLREVRFTEEEDGWLGSTLIIQEGAFWGCINLESIQYLYSGSFQDTQIKFNMYSDVNAFNLCSKLSKITFANQQTAIPAYTFSGCTGLKDVIGLYNGGTRSSFIYVCPGYNAGNYDYFAHPAIGSNAFNNCYNLEKLSLCFLGTINIGENAFRGCSKLSQLYIDYVSIPRLSSFSNSFFLSLPSYVFSSTPFTTTSYLGYYGSIYVASSIYASLRYAPGWSSLQARMVSF